MFRWKGWEIDLYDIKLILLYRKISPTNGLNQKAPLRHDGSGATRVLTTCQKKTRICLRVTNRHTYEDFEITIQREEFPQCGDQSRDERDVVCLCGEK
jgi:hypothetical protein